MALQDIDIRATTTAAPEQVWRLLDDSLSWPSWTPIDSAKILEASGRDGLGEVRMFTTGRVTVTEEIIERDEPNRLSYTLLKGLAVRSYRADISVASDTGRTQIRWHTTFKPKMPGSGWVYKRALRKATQEFVDGLASHAAGGRAPIES